MSQFGAIPKKNFEYASGMKLWRPIPSLNVFVSS